MSIDLTDALDRLSRLQLFASLLRDDPPPSELMDIVVRQGIAGVDAEGGVLALLLADDVVDPVVTVGYDAERVGSWGELHLTDDLPLTAAIARAEPFFIATPDDALQHFSDMSAVVTPSKAWAVIPLRGPRRAFGALGLSFASTHDFDEHDRLFLCALADMTAVRLSRSLVADAALGDRSRPDLAVLQETLIYLFEVSMRVLSLAEDPRTHPDAQARLRQVVADLDGFSAQCRRRVFEADFLVPERDRIVAPAFPSRRRSDQRPGAEG